MASLRSALSELRFALANSAVGQFRSLHAELDLLKSRVSRPRSGNPPRTIAMVSGDMCKTPPVGYGGVERSFYYQARDLAQRGWNVHLWGDFQDPSTGIYEGITLHDGVDYDGFEILRVNPDILYQAYPNVRQAARVLRSSEAVVVCEYNAPECLAPLSESMHLRCMNELFRNQAIAKGYKPDQVICVPLYQESETEYRPAVPREDWLLWVGRPSPCKALEEAFLFSSQTGIELRVACRTPDLENDGYARALWRLMPPTVKYIGEVNREQKRDLFSRCRALLYTAQPTWREAFGLIFLDALASGTPVVAMDHHPGSTQSSFFPGVPYGLRASSIEELATLYQRHGEELLPEAVAARYQEIYGDEKVEKSLEAALSRLLPRSR